MTLQREALCSYAFYLSFACFPSHQEFSRNTQECRRKNVCRKRVRLQSPVKPAYLFPRRPTPRKAGNGRFWFGTDRLWTNLPENGMLRGLADEITSAHPTISEKVFWWRQGYDARVEPRPRLRVTGKRIDSPAPPLEVSPTTNAFTQNIAAMLVGIGFPANGCWQISARYDDDELTFVIWVAAPLTTAVGHY